VHSREGVAARIIVRCCLGLFGGGGHFVVVLVVI
jgi:hypothetical protein